MENLQVCLRAVLPLVLIIGIGYLAKTLHAIDRNDVPKLNKLAFRYFIPVMLFYNLYTSDLDHAIQASALLYTLLAVVAVYGLSLSYVLLTEKETLKKGVKIQGMYRSNTAIVGLSLAGALLGKGSDLGAVVLMVATVVPVFNVLAVITLEAFNGRRPSVKKLLLDIVTNPLIVGSVVGILALLAGIRLPYVVEATVQQMAAATNPLLLFLLGAFFEFKGLRRYAKDLAEVCLVRLVIVPALTLIPAMLLGFREASFAGMIAVFASSTAINSFTMTQQMGGDAELAGDIVVLTNALCPFTMFFWALLFKSLGVF